VTFTFVEVDSRRPHRGPASQRAVVQLTPLYYRKVYRPAGPKSVGPPGQLGPPSEVGSQTAFEPMRFVFVAVAPAAASRPARGGPNLRPPINRKRSGPPDQKSWSAGPIWSTVPRGLADDARSRGEKALFFIQPQKRDSSKASFSKRSPAWSVPVPLPRHTRGSSTLDKGPIFRNTPGTIRTCDLRFRKPPLYPTELRVQKCFLLPSLLWPKPGPFADLDLLISIAQIAHLSKVATAREKETP
jgi:hypothetical protein